MQKPRMQTPRMQKTAPFASDSCRTIDSDALFASELHKRPAQTTLSASAMRGMAGLERPFCERGATERSVRRGRVSAWPCCSRGR